MFGFIGAGKVGTTLGMYFNNMHLPISGYNSKSLASAKKSAALTNSNTYENITQLVDSSKYIMITTPDDLIEDVVLQLISINAKWDDKVVCHTSGTHPSTILEPLSKLGSTTLSLHPMLSFADINYALTMLPQTPLTLEGKGNLTDDFRKILLNINLEIHNISSEQKSLYHAAACIVSNYLVTVIDTGLETLNRIGLKQESSLELIESLVKGTINNIFEKGTVNALTGPMARGDVHTIKTHIRALSREDRSLEQFYRLLGDRTLSLVKKQNKLNEYTLNTLKEVLQGENCNYTNNKEQEKE
ncbi:Rossmann-like and DUF2520 domain-containing protein [Vallitalea sp.]|jgi:predicted short-subunit dehydrogenase-like oxidoreductase (DUF2520 family)|uniref:Rossmann-like and DUF2520 domain-containing protein n=1 Tax=Vallitalea sp. TaxID=1882829 RepID=UPI0025E95ACD|nr:Rossmann-like and DUF2520 domain-containing protein [Vallitalea sp.]MCT4688173.1 DUF2520 domain-containing protein [Vallitalea sp.]